MKILAFESSCDETAVAVVEDGRRVLSDAIASQADLHALYGGVVPELASRKHVEVIAALTEKALADAGCTRQDIDAVAVTYAPGLIGAVLVGLSFAKSVAYGLGVPLIPVHHVRGHIAANYLAFPELEPPFLALAIPMHALIPLSCLVCFFKDACMIAMHVRFCRFDAMPWLLLGAVPGSFAGVYLLQICSGAVLQGIVGILLLFFVYWQLYVHGGRGGGARLQPVGVACGFGAGLLGTGIALDGPPMAAFGLAVGWEPRVFLGTVSVFFMLRGIITLVLQWWHGFLTPEVLGMAMYGTPGVMLGSLAAFPVVKRINVLLFRRVLLAIIAICGVVCLVRSIW